MSSARTKCGSLRTQNETGYFYTISVPLIPVYTHVCVCVIADLRDIAKIIFLSILRDLFYAIFFFFFLQVRSRSSLTVHQRTRVSIISPVHRGIHMFTFFYNGFTSGRSTTRVSDFRDYYHIVICWCIHNRNSKVHIFYYKLTICWTHLETCTYSYTLILYIISFDISVWTVYSGLKPHSSLIKRPRVGIYIRLSWIVIPSDINLINYNNIILS